MSQHYDLYESLGLSRSDPSESLDQQLAQRLSQTPPSRAGAREELTVARAILGHPGRRERYDTRLDDTRPEAPVVTISSLRDLAQRNIPMPAPAPQQDWSTTGTDPSWALPGAGAQAATNSSSNPRGAQLKEFSSQAGAKAKVAGASIVDLFKRKPVPAWGLVSIAVVSVIAIGACSVFGGSNGNGGGTGNVAQFDSAGWGESFHGDGEDLAQQFMDPDLIERSLLYKTTFGNYGSIPNGKLEDFHAVESRPYIAAIPGAGHHVVNIGEPESGLQVRSIGFAEEDGDPIIVRLGAKLNPSEGVTQETYSIVVERFNAMSEEKIDETEFGWNPADYIEGSRVGSSNSTNLDGLVYADGKAFAHAGGSILELDIHSGELRRILGETPGDGNLGDIDYIREVEVVYDGSMAYIATKEPSEPSVRLINTSSGDVYVPDPNVQAAGGGTGSIDVFSSSEGIVISNVTDHGTPGNSASVNENGLPTSTVMVWQEDGGVKDQFESSLRVQSVQGQYIIGFENGEYLSIVDLTTGQEFFSMSGEQLQGTSVTDVFTDGEYVYVLDSSGIQVVDPGTGNPVEGEEPTSIPSRYADGYEIWLVPLAPGGWASDKYAEVAVGIDE